MRHHPRLVGRVASGLVVLVMDRCKVQLVDDAGDELCQEPPPGVSLGLRW
jgi:hypothetical protein